MAPIIKDRINHHISSKTIIVIDEDGTKLGAMPNHTAQKLAQDKGLDLIEISVNKQTGETVARISDYGKFIYEKKKKEKAADKLQRENSIDTKEIQLRPNTDDRDIEIKAKKSLQFLDDGNRIRVILQMKNRELSHKDVGKAVITKFLAFITAEDIEKPIYSEGNNFVAVLFRKRK